MRFLFKKAFTMAEAILVMTILGIIATIMITTLKPADFKDKGMQVLAKKVLSEIDTATTQILINDSLDGTMKTLHLPNSSNTFEFGKDCDSTLKLYKKYLTFLRKPYIKDPSSGWAHSGSGSAVHIGGYLKDGAWFGLFCMGNQTGTEGSRTIFPGEVEMTAMGMSQGRIMFDINAEEEPNQAGKDYFAIPVGDNGIIYAEN